jgi:hypothetical protein
MITFNMLGQLGRLGNQMFQYASTAGIAQNNNLDFSVPQNSILYDYFELPKMTSCFNYNYVYAKDQVGFDEELFNTCSDNSDIIGYLQTEKYFKHIENEIRKHFTFKNFIQNKVNNFFIQSNLKDVKKVSLHIRRTDYLTDTNFVNLDLSYYLKALKNFENIPVIIFSDDIEWCRAQDIFNSDRFYFCNLNEPILDLYAMTQCNYHIIANSSFSWWGSWLAKSERTVAPQLWYCGQLSSWSTKDLYLNDWIVV